MAATEPAPILKITIYGLVALIPDQFISIGGVVIGLKNPRISLGEPLPPATRNIFTGVVKAVMFFQTMGEYLLPVRINKLVFIIMIQIALQRPGILCPFVPIHPKSHTQAVPVIIGIITIRMQSKGIQSMILEVGPAVCGVTNLCTIVHSSGKRLFIASSKNNESAPGVLCVSGYNIKPPLTALAPKIATPPE